MDVFDGIVPSDHMLSSFNLDPIDLTGCFPSQMSSFNSICGNPMWSNKVSGFDQNVLSSNPFHTTTSFGNNEWDLPGFDSFHLQGDSVFCEPSSLQGLQEISPIDFPSCFLQEFQTTDDDLLKCLVTDLPAMPSQSSVSSLTGGVSSYNTGAVPNGFASPTVVPKKGLFSQLGLDHLLSTSDQFSAPKRRRVDCSASVDTKSCITEQPDRAEEPSKATKKRARPGESTRPRPKDRQMIQDRLKELREIIPNSAKCSIDLLLDHTIKHMLFLQGVTKYADKLKQADELKTRTDVDNGGISGSAAWAIDVGGQNPIIVEDLGESGQMRIEMLCEGHGFFLEIADVIRSLGLTILKGVVEARGEKVWAHFIAEANRNVTRMQVLMSLLQLLQDTSTKTIADDSNFHRLG